MNAIAQFTENSVRLIGWSDNPCLILMEQFDSSLDSFLVLPRETPLGLSCVLGILLDVCDALSICERMSLVHNDIKPKNILVRSETSAGTIKCFLNDYGCAEIYRDNRVLRKSLRKGTLGVTRHYAAPELLELFSSDTTRVRLHENKSDLYSFAITAYEVLFQRSAWTKEEDVMVLVPAGKRPSQVESVANYYLDLNPALYSCIWKDIVCHGWQQDPILRGSFRDILRILGKYSSPSHGERKG